MIIDSKVMLSRANAADVSLETCIAFGCTQPTQRVAKNGLSHVYCKRHVEYIRRHGISWAKKPTKAALAPYRATAASWYKARKGECHASRVVARLDAMLAHSGNPISAYSLRGKSLDARARNVLARNREAGKTGKDLLIIVLSIRAYMEDHGPRAAPDYRHMQIAKLMHRISSGTNTTTSGFPMPRKNPRPEGRFMIHLGKKVDDVASIVADMDAAAEVAEMAKAISSCSRGQV